MFITVVASPIPASNIESLSMPAKIKFETRISYSNMHVVIIEPAILRKFFAFSPAVTVASSFY